MKCFSLLEPLAPRANIPAVKQALNQMKNHDVLLIVKTSYLSLITMMEQYGKR